MKPSLPLFLIILSAVSLAAQERIDQTRIASQRINTFVFQDRLDVQWLPDGKSFWYQVPTEDQKIEFVLINAETGKRGSASDLPSLGLPPLEPLRSSTTTIDFRRTERNGPSSGITFANELDSEVQLFWINQQGDRIPYGSIEPRSEREQHTYAGHVWLVTNPTGEPLAIIEAQVLPTTLQIDGKGTQPSKRRTRRSRGNDSPDGEWSVTLEDGRVILTRRETSEKIHLKTDLDDQAPYQSGVSWSPDSSGFVVSNTPDVPQRKVTIVESSPNDGLQPKPKEFDYTKPGDPLPKPVPVHFQVRDDGYDWKAIDTALFPNPFTESNRLSIEWAPGGHEFYINYNERGHQLYRILAIDASTGDVRTVVEETSQTFIDYRTKTWRHWLHDTRELLWTSERDGWCHLYLYDTTSGDLKNQVTTGAWPIREVLHVDEDHRQVWFLASGLNPDQDPYHIHLCRVNFDGSGFQQLTQSDGNHRIEFSPTREYVIASWSRVDHPPVHELRHSDDGTLITILEQADASQLLSTGWTMPERFVAKSRDGQTDIHGLLIKPSNFDPSKKYPIVEQIYAGPHSAHAPKSFGRLPRQHQMADLGFIVVQIDGMGTNHRGKAFHDVAWKNLKDAGFPDRIAWIKAAAESRPWMDLDRVGIYGGSAGGQNAMRALLDHHDFYRVAVADCGCHDNRMDKIWWNEQWMGWPVDASYAQSSNVEDAHKLEGHLLLIVGELDTNVDPASTMQVVAALQKANKAFDFMPLANTGHGAAETPYGSRLREEFLVKHLLTSPDQAPNQRH